MQSTLTLSVAAAALALVAAQNTTDSIPPAIMNLPSSSSNAQLSVAFDQRDGNTVEIQPALLLGKQGM